jgi:hypothetical protein
MLAWESSSEQGSALGVSPGMDAKTSVILPWARTPELTTAHIRCLLGSNSSVPGAHPSHSSLFLMMELRVITVAEPLSLAFTELIAGAFPDAGGGTGALGVIAAELKAEIRTLVSFSPSALLARRLMICFMPSGFFTYYFSHFFCLLGFFASRHACACRCFLHFLLYYSASYRSQLTLWTLQE